MRNGQRANGRLQLTVSRTVRAVVANPGHGHQVVLPPQPLTKLVLALAVRAEVLYRHFAVLPSLALVLCIAPYSTLFVVRVPRVTLDTRH